MGQLQFQPLLYKNERLITFPPNLTTIANILCWFNVNFDLAFRMFHKYNKDVDFFESIENLFYDL